MPKALAHKRDLCVDKKQNVEEQRLHVAREVCRADRAAAVLGREGSWKLAAEMTATKEQAEVLPNLPPSYSQLNDAAYDPRDVRLPWSANGVDNLRRLLERLV